jgi:hypothetical protein
VDNYTAKLYRLVACVDLVVSYDQLVSRYNEGIKQLQFQDALNFFNPINASKAN